MTSKEYIIWLRGFVAACNSYLPTPAQWDELVETLNNVDITAKKSSIFDSEKKNVFDLGTVNLPSNYWNTNSNNQEKQLLND